MRLLCSVACAIGLACPALADTKQALVIAGSVSERDQALAMSEVLLGLGFDVARFEAPEKAEITQALDAIDASDDATVVYVAGDVVAWQDLVGTAPKAPRFVFVDDCAPGIVDDLPDNVFLATAQADCATPLSDSLQDLLSVPGLRTDQWGADLGTISTLKEPYTFRTASSDIRLTPDDYAMLETLSPAARNRMIDLWRSAGIPVDFDTEATPVSASPSDVVRVSPVAPVAVVRPVTARATDGGVNVNRGVSVVTRPQTTAIAPPAPVVEGLPQPSILVGYVVENLPAAPLVPDDPLAGNAFGGEDVTAREALRAQDEAAFEGLVAAGAFDPPENDIARALQVELARINCYTIGIDGAWGAGSQRALAAFYAEIGEPVPTGPADLESFRDVVARADIRCPDPAPVVVAQPVSQPVAQPPAAAPATPAVQPARAPTTTAAPSAPAPETPAPQTNRRSINQTGGTGVFR